MVKSPTPEYIFWVSFQEYYHNDDVEDETSELIFRSLSKINTIDKLEQLRWEISQDIFNCPTIVFNCWPHLLEIHNSEGNNLNDRPEIPQYPYCCYLY